MAESSHARSTELDLSHPSVWDLDDRSGRINVLPDHVSAGRQAAEDCRQRRAGLGGTLVDTGVDPESVRVDATDLDLPAAEAFTRGDHQGSQPATDVDGDAGSCGRCPDVRLCCV